MSHLLRSLSSRHPWTVNMLIVGGVAASMYKLAVFEKSRCEEEQRIIDQTTKNMDCGLSSRYQHADPFAQTSFAQALYSRDLCQQKENRWRMKEDHVRTAVDAIHLG